MTDNFIHSKYISKTICNKLVSYYNNNLHMVKPGALTKGIDKNVKDSFDIDLELNNTLLKEYFLLLNKVVLSYCKKFKYITYNQLYGIKEKPVLQFYKKNGGFKKWHFERTCLINSNRLFAFMTYLNNVEDGGTMFYYQKKTFQAKKGLTLIWPADWTHTHKGQISKTKEKYIITGWLNYVN